MNSIQQIRLPTPQGSLDVFVKGRNHFVIKEYVSLNIIQRIIFLVKAILIAPFSLIHDRSNNRFKMAWQQFKINKKIYQATVKRDFLTTCKVENGQLTNPEKIAKILQKNKAFEAVAQVKSKSFSADIGKLIVSFTGTKERIALRKTSVFWSDLVQEQGKNEKTMIAKYVEELIASLPDGMQGIDRIREGLTHDAINVIVLDSGARLNFIDKVIFANLDILNLLNTNEEIKKNKRIALIALRHNGLWYINLSDDFKKNREIIWVAIKQNPRVYQHIPIEFKDDREIVEFVLKQKFSLIRHATDATKNNRLIFLKGIEHSGENLRFASDALKNDKELVLLAFEDSALNLRYASDLLKDNEEIVLKAIRGNYRQSVGDLLGPGGGEAPTPLRYASDRLKGKREVVIEAMERNPTALRFASPALRDNKEFILEVIDKYDTVDRMLCVTVGQADLKLLEWASPRLQDDKDVVLAALKKNKKNIAFATENVKKHKEIYWFLNKL